MRDEREDEESEERREEGNIHGIIYTRCSHRTNTVLIKSESFL